MSPLTQVFLGLTGLTGLGVAVGVPVALHVRGKSDELTKKDQGGGNSQVSVLIEKCVNSINENGQEISFGSQTQDKVCWSLDKSTESSHAGTDKDQQLTHLLQQLWAKKQELWSSYNDHWRNDCFAKGNKWIFTDRVEEKEYMGLCEGVTEALSIEDFSHSTPTDQWILVENKKTDSPTVKLCTGECFESKSVGDWKKWIPSTDKGAWSSIKFRKQTSK